MSIKIVKGSYSTILDATSLSGNHTVSFPDSSGTVALTDQLATVATSGSYNDLTDKPNIPESQAGYITQTWKSGNNWYRKWSDGWIEQGGFQSSNSAVTFPISYTQTGITVVGTARRTYSGDSYNNFDVNSVSLTGFSWIPRNGSGCYWASWGY